MKKNETSEQIKSTMNTNTSEETSLFRSIIEDEANGVLVAERSSRTLIYANDTARNIYGLPSEGSVAGSFVDYMHTNGYETLLSPDEIGELSFDSYKVFHKEREGCYLSVRAKLLMWRGVESYILYVIDETVSREQKIMTDSLINQIPGGIIAYRIGETIDTMYFSDGIPALSGHTAEEYREYVKGGDVFERFVFKEDMPGFKKTVAEAVAARAPFSYIYRLRHKDGYLRWIEVSAKPVRTEKNAIIYYAIFTLPAKEAELYRSVVDDSSTGVYIAERKKRHLIYVNAVIVKMFDVEENYAKARVSSSKTLPERFKLLSDEEIESLNENTYSTFNRVWNDRYFSISAKAITWNETAAYILYISDETEEHNRLLQLKNVFDLIPSGIAVYELNQNGITPRLVNEGFSAMMAGYTDMSDSPDGSSIITRIHPDDFPALQKCVRELYSGSHDSCDIMFRSRIAADSYIWLRIVGTIAQRLADKALLYASVTDVTEQVNEREAIRLSEKKQKDILDTIPSGILEFSFDGKTLSVLSANQTLISMIGYDEEEFFQKKTWLISEVVHKDDLESVHEANLSAGNGKGQAYDFRILNKKTGLYRWISCDFNVLERTEERVVVLSAFLDIDEKRKLESASEAKSRFLSRMSHDMRTPMNGILGMTRILQKMHGLSAEARESLDAISDSSYFLLGLINDTLEMSRIESGKVELHPEVIRADDLVGNVIKTVMPTAQKKNISIECVPINAELEYIRVDRLRTQQIFMNVLSNAIKFTPDGGKVRIEIECLKRENSIAYDRISVEDNGIGMSEEFQKHIFEPFSQENSYSATGMVGTGLGMSIVKQLVDMMGGRIEVSSKKGVGTKITVYLNFERVYDVAECPDASAAASVEALHGKRILFAEDHPLNAKITKRLLEDAGCLVVHAKNGELAVKQFAESPIEYFSAILMDIRMPVMDGIEATKRIRALARQDAKTVPIIAVTANAYDTDKKETASAGMNQHLSKPVEPELLYETLAAYINAAPPGTDKR